MFYSLGLILRHENTEIMREVESGESWHLSLVTASKMGESLLMSTPGIRMINIYQERHGQRELVHRLASEIDSSIKS